MRNKLISGVIVSIAILAISCVARADDLSGQDDEAMRLASEMTSAVMRQDTAAAANLLDADALFDRVSAGVSAPADFLAGVKSGFKEQVVSTMDAVVKAAGGGAYHFLRVRQVNGEVHILFRLLQKRGGVNYHDWIAGYDQQGQLRFQDAYIAATGELMSQSMHRLFVQGVIATYPGLLNRLTGNDKELAANFSKMLQLVQDSQKAHYQQLLDDYKQLPTSVQEDKSCLLLRFAAAEKLREQLPGEYNAAMADYRRLFPRDPSVDFICLDETLAAKRFAEARQCLDHLDTFTGGDAYLLFLRGSTYKTEGGNENLRQAKKFYQEAIDEEPTLAKAYWGLVEISLETRQYEETAALLTEIQQKLHVKIKDLTTLPTYAGFVTSDAYKQWIAKQSPATLPTAVQ